MINFFLKLLLCPGVIFLADAFSPWINYANSWQIIYSGLFIGIIGYMMDFVVLKYIGSLPAAFLDTSAAALIIFLSQFFLPGAAITLYGLLLTAALLGIGEYLVHRLVIVYRSRRIYS